VPVHHPRKPEKPIPYRAAAFRDWRRWWPAYGRVETAEGPRSQSAQQEDSEDEERQTCAMCLWLLPKLRMVGRPLEFFLVLPVRRKPPPYTESGADRHLRSGRAA